MKNLIVTTGILLAAATSFAGTTINCKGKPEQLVLNQDSISFRTESYSYVNLKIKKNGTTPGWSQVIQTAPGASSNGLGATASFVVRMNYQGDKLIQFDVLQTNQGFANTSQVLSCESSSIILGQAEQADAQAVHRFSGVN